MKYVISNLIWENKAKATVKELLPTKNKGQSLNNLEQNNNLPYCNDNENNQHKIGKKVWQQPCLFQGKRWQFTEALYKRLIIKNKLIKKKKKTMLLPRLLKLAGRGEQIKLVLQLLLLFVQERRDAIGRI